MGYSIPSIRKWHGIIQILWLQALHGWDDHFLLMVFMFLLDECWVCSNWLACLFSLFDFGDGWSDVGVRMSRGAPGGSAAGTGSDAEPAQALAAHAFQENLCHGQEPRPRAPRLWWVSSVYDDGTWNAELSLASLHINHNDFVYFQQKCCALGHEPYTHIDYFSVMKLNTLHETKWLSWNHSNQATVLHTDAWLLERLTFVRKGDTR